MPELWSGTAAGKAAHHSAVVDTDGTKALSCRVPNNEAALLELIGWPLRDWDEIAVDLKMLTARRYDRRLLRCRWHRSGPVARCCSRRSLPFQCGQPQFELINPVS